MQGNEIKELEVQRRRDSNGMFDLVRGIGMLLIVLAHSYGPYSDFPIWAGAIYLTLSYAVMPAFFMVSGYGFVPQKMKKYIKKRIKFILRPYCYVALGVFFLFPTIHYLFFRNVRGAVTEMLRLFLAFVLGISGTTNIKVGPFELYDCGPVWFLLVLLNAGVLMNAICKVKNKKIQVLLVILSVSFGMFLTPFGALPYCLQSSLIVVGYIYAGYQICQYRLLWEKHSWWVYGILIICWTIGVTCSGINIAGNVWKLGIFDVILTILSGYAMLRILMLAHGHMNVILRAICMIGKYSLWVMCVHTLEMICIPWYLFTSKMADYPVAGCLSLFAMHCILIFLGCYGLRKFIRFKGKRKRKQRNKIEKSGY